MTFLDFLDFEYWFWLEPVLKSPFITSVSQVKKRAEKRQLQGNNVSASSHAIFFISLLRNKVQSSQEVSKGQTQHKHQCNQCSGEQVWDKSPSQMHFKHKWYQHGTNYSTCLKYKHKHRIFQIQHRALDVTQLICWQALHVLSLSHSIIPSCPSLSLRCQELALNYIMLTLYLSGQFRVAHLCSAEKESISSYNITSIWVEATDLITAVSMLLIQTIDIIRYRVF